MLFIIIGVLLGKLLHIFSFYIHIRVHHRRNIHAFVKEKRNNYFIKFTNSLLTTSVCSNMPLGLIRELEISKNAINNIKLYPKVISDYVPIVKIWLGINLYLYRF